MFDVLFCLGRCRIHSLVSFFSLGQLLSLEVLFLAFSGVVLIYVVLFSGLFYGISIFSDSVDFIYSKGSFFLNFPGASLRVFFYRAFLLSGSLLSSTPCIGLLCLLRMHAINSCVNDT